ncbi:hypothetical protein EST38_g557 [Candolleomyces aberdarensis]|uniref:WIBG Mago-binding domain-containing protein n=1 Tax=Candolleomyces aberdarensis TaxID=2316362 RepID=A0A4Q2E057_9AGAR|nr:hypothetical protein EST38_g557 [Candolleomyces aberdarensis]
MSKPPLNPDKTAAGIALDPQTLERVVPESRRPDGSVRKQLKIRPGFTPQEDVKRFRGTKQAQMDQNALPKGHIIGWVPPSSASSASKPLSKSAKKNAKRKEKRTQEKVAEVQNTPVPDSWEDDEDEEGDKDAAVPAAETDATKTPPELSNIPDSADATSDLVDELEKLNVK